MGMVPIPVISALTLSRPEEPFLEPPLPVDRVQPESFNTGEQRDETYSPRHDQSPPDEPPRESEAQSSPIEPDPHHTVNVFA